MPKISVILPCYNVAKYISACLDSLLNQTLRDIEIICVDDKSSDDTAEIIKQYVAKDARIRLIEQKKNGGVSIARNTGIDAASGEYIGFVDPDDWVDTDFYEKLYKAAVENKADIAKADLTVVDLDGILIRGRLNRYVKQNKLNFQFEFTSAIYRKKLLDKHNLRFLPAISIGEDVNMQTKAAFLANKVAVIDSTSYMYIRREDSAYSTYLPHDKIEKVCEAATELLTWLNAQDNVRYSDYMNILRPVFSMQINAIKKSKTYQDKIFVCNCIIDTYNKAKYQEHLLKQSFKKRSRSAIKQRNVDKLLKSLESKRKRYKLFGVIPVIKIQYVTGQECEVFLFEFISLFRYVYGQYNDKIYLLWMQFLKITH